MYKAITIALVFLGLNVFGQTNTFTPYSIYGLGEPNRSSTTSMASMGHANIAVISPTLINPTNPASYTDITRPAFNLDLKNELLTLSSGPATQASNAFSIQNIAFAFPILNDSRKYKRRMGLSFGLTPFSNVGYDLASTSTVPELGEVEYRFIGDGGVNTVHAGLGYDLLCNDKRTRILSVGANANYLFGTLTKNRITQLSPSAAGSSVYRQTNTEISDIDWSAGIRYARIDTATKTVVDKEGNTSTEEVLIIFSAGAYVRPATDLNSFSQQVEFTYTDSFNRPNVIDTLLGQSINGGTTSPLSFGVGTSVNIASRWTLALDYHFTNWSQLRVSGVDDRLKNAHRISFGSEFVPEFDNKNQYFRVIRYRAGFSFEQSGLNINGAQPLRYGINLGLGLPLRTASASTSMFNIGMELARRETSGLPLNETYFNIHAGFTITPHRYDQWFAKRKYD